MGIPSWSSNAYFSLKVPHTLDPDPSVYLPPPQPYAGYGMHKYAHIFETFLTFKEEICCCSRAVTNLKFDLQANLAVRTVENWVLCKKFYQDLNQRP